MERLDAFNNIEAIVVESPVDKIIRQLKNLISSGQLKPGDRLPAERILAEKFGVGRGYIREAILKLEFYGLVKTSPQSGTYICGHNLKILDSIFSDIISANKNDFASMIEARYSLEINSARLAAERRTESDIFEMKEALAEFDVRINQGDFAAEEDMLFHIRLAIASKNSVIESMIIVLIPNLIKIKNIMDKDITKERTITLNQHHKILNAVINQDVKLAGEAMAEHLSEMMSIRESFKNS